MKKFGKIVLVVWLLVVVSGFSGMMVFAADDDDSGSTTTDGSAPEGTLLPGTNTSVDDCREKLDDKNAEENQKKLADRKDVNDILGCGIKTGIIKAWMIPYYIRYVAEFVIGIAALVAVGGIVYGGFVYMFAGLSEDKEKGKNALKFALIGMVLTMTAWGIVTVVIALVTR